MHHIPTVALFVSAEQCRRAYLMEGVIEHCGLDYDFDSEDQRDYDPEWLLRDNDTAPATVAASEELQRAFTFESEASRGGKTSRES